jgi:hypothetical protein
VAVATSRRYGADPRAMGSQPPSQARLPMRETQARSERAPVNFPSLDNDWDVPAFQRKNQ